MITRIIGNAFPPRPLGQVVEFLDSRRRPVKESERKPGPYPYYGANGQQGTIDDYIFDEDLVLLAEDGGFFDAPERGIAYRITGKTWVNNHAHVLRMRPGLDVDYLCRVLENYDVIPYVSGTTRSKLTKTQAEKIPIPLPPLEVQKRIAKILDYADKIWSLRQTFSEKVHAIRRAIYIEMFGGLTLNHTNFEQHPLSVLCLEINDCPHSTPNWTESGIVCLRTSNIVQGGWDWSDKRFVCDADFHQRSLRGYLRAGDIVLSREGTVGVAAIIPEDLTACMGQRLVQVRPNPSLLDSTFLLQFLLSALSPERISRLMVGSTSRHLNLRDLRSLKVPQPPLSLQKAFAERLAVIDGISVSASQAEQASASLFASLRERAFRGELNLKAARRELAEAN
jgi:type I restriction enzyme, S subunit